MRHLTRSALADRPETIEVVLVAEGMSRVVLAVARVHLAVAHHFDVTAPKRMKHLLVLARDARPFEQARHVGTRALGGIDESHQFREQEAITLRGRPFHKADLPEE